MTDRIVRATAADGQLRAMAVVGTKLVDEARIRHNCSKTATAALGRSLMATLLLGANLKGEDTITLRIIGDGPLGAIICSADATGKVRGYLQEPDVDLPVNDKGKIDVSGGVGTKGFLHVTKDLGLKEPYTGSSPIVSGEIAEDITYYFATSEQVPSVVALGVLVDRDLSVKAAAGYIVQVMPGASEETISQLEQIVTDILPVSTLAEQNLSPEEILNTVLANWEVKILETNPVFFGCNCHRERLEGILISLGEKELTDMIEEQGEAELTCHFCADKYHFNKAELTKLLKEGLN